jgi:hypothetical protein
MSHNKIKVAGQEPNASGDITVAIDNLSDVSTSGVSSGEVIKYNGSSWDTGSPPAGSPQYILVGQGESSAYSNSTATALAQGDSLQIYDTSPKNTITGASLTSTSNWIREITLPAGQYFVQCQTNVVFSASGYLLFNLAKTSDDNEISNSALIGDNSTSYASGVASTLQSFMDLSSSETFKIRFGQSSNVASVANQGTTPSQHSFLFIMKV